MGHEEIILHVRWKIAMCSRPPKMDIPEHVTDRPREQRQTAQE